MNNNIFDSNFSIYLKEIENIPLLNDLEENELFIAYKNGNKDAKKKLMECNLRLVIKIAKEYASAKNEILDLIQEGNIALQRAVETFDIDKNIKFSTYAYSCIENKIISYIRKNRMISISNNKLIRLWKINKFKNDFFIQYGRMPKNEEIIASLHINQWKLKKINELPTCDISLNQKMKDNESELQDLIINNKFDLDDIIINNDFWNQFTRDGTLTPLEKEVLVAKIYRNNVELKNIEVKYQISRDTCRRIGEKALKKIKYKWQLDIMHEYMSDDLINNNFIDIKAMNKISILLPYLKKLSSKSFFSMVKQNGILKATLICFCFGYLNTSDFTIKDIANILEINESKLSHLASNLFLELKKDYKKTYK